MRMLKNRLWQLEEQKRQDEMAQIQGDKKAIDFGSQIRSYFLHPYQMVNDHRTSLKTSNVHAVLDGDLNGLIESFLLSAQGAGEASEE